MQGRCLALLSESPLDLPNSQLLLRATRAKKKKKLCLPAVWLGQAEIRCSWLFQLCGLGLVLCCSCCTTDCYQCALQFRQNFGGRLVEIEIEIERERLNRCKENLRRVDRPSL